MIREVKIQNYKSIESLDLELGRINVLIGENGCGKTNILEAIALASAAYSDKLDNEFLVSRGIRVTEPQLMRSAFEKQSCSENVILEIEDSEKENDFEFFLFNQNEPYSKWYIDQLYKLNSNQRKQLHNEYIQNNKHLEDVQSLAEQLKPIWNNLLEREVKQNNWEFGKPLSESYKLEMKKGNQEKIQQFLIEKYMNFVQEKLKVTDLKVEKKIGVWEDSILVEFMVFSPIYKSLKKFEEEGQIQPLGIHGEGLFKFLQFLDMQKDKIRFNEIKERLRLISWFEDFEIPQDLFGTERKIYITDKYLDRDLKYFDQRSSNEGFLFTLFYLALFVGEETPKFFAIDNIDNALNPKLCWRVIEELVELAKKYDKQAIFTTHNPAILDGLDLEDDEQRLFVISRSKFGRTRAKRIFSPKKIEGQEPVRLSEAFLRGYIGGMPKNF